MTIISGPAHWYVSWRGFTVLAVLAGATGMFLLGVAGLLALAAPVAIVGALAVRPSSAFHSCPRCGVALQWR